MSRTLPRRTTTASRGGPLLSGPRARRVATNEENGKPQNPFLLSPEDLSPITGVSNRGGRPPEPAPRFANVTIPLWTTRSRLWKARVGHSLAPETAVRLTPTKWGAAPFRYPGRPAPQRCRFRGPVGHLGEHLDRVDEQVIGIEAECPSYLSLRL
jgi:hypothetical protein